MRNEALTPLERFRQADEAWRATVDTLNAARAASRVAFDVYQEARYAAVVSIPCPYCPAQPGEPCQYPPNVDYHRNVTHGRRDDLAGVNGEFSQNKAAYRQVAR
jgi:hypothetical protein